MIVDDLKEGNNECPICGLIIIVYKGQIVNTIDHLICISNMEDDY